MRFKHWTMNDHRLAVDINLVRFQTMTNLIANRSEARYQRKEIWTDRSADELQRDGYKRVSGLHDSLVWWGVPIYLRINGGDKFDIHQVDANGVPLYSQDTAATLHDVMQSRATESFIKGMGKTQLSSMDTQKILLIGIIGAAAVLGMWMLGVFR